MARIRINEVSGIARLAVRHQHRDRPRRIAGGASTIPLPAIIGALVGLYFLFAIKVVRQWEKVAVLRLGRYVGLRGPGLCHIIPIIETLSPYVDQRVRVASVSAESTLTRDTVPVNVDAIVFWMVWNAEKSHSRSRKLHRGHQHERTNRAARIHRPPRTRANDHRARNHGPRTAAHPRRKDQSLGHHRAVR